MVELFVYEDCYIRFLSEEICIIGKNNGRRHILNRQESNIMYNLIKSVGLENALRIVDNLEYWPYEYRNIGVEIYNSFNSLKSGAPTRLNKLLEQDPILIEHSKRNRIPLLGIIEITSKCNLRCRHCYISHKVSVDNSMPIQYTKATEILESLAELGCIDLSITGGEPSFYENCIPLIKKAKSLHMYTILKTNGTNISKAFMEEYCINPAHETHVSIYGSTSELHDSFTGVKHSFERTVIFLKELAERGVRCLLVCTVWKGNEDVLDDIRHMAKRLGHDIVFDDIITGRLDCDTSPHEFRISKEKRKSLIEKEYLTPFMVTPCSAGRSKIKINSDGSLSICELLPQQIGNIYNSSLKELWESTEIKGFSNKIIKISKSQRKNNRNILSCPGMNYINTGKMEGVTYV